MRNRRERLLLKIPEIINLLYLTLKSLPNSRVQISLRAILQQARKLGLVGTLESICLDAGYNYKTCAKHEYFLKLVLQELAKYCPSIDMMLLIMQRGERLDHAGLTRLLKEMELDYAWYQVQIDMIRKLLYRAEQ